MSDKVIRIHLKTNTYNSVKTIRVSEKAKQKEIIKEALIKNHIPLTEIDQYELSNAAEGADGSMVEMVLKPKGFGGPKGDQQAFFNPLYGADEGNAESQDPLDDSEELAELLDKETDLRIAAETRAAKAEQSLDVALHRIKELEEQLEKLQHQTSSSSVEATELEKLKKKSTKQKVEIEKLKTALEIKEEIITDLRAEIEELQSGRGKKEEVAKKPNDQEWELQSYLDRASLKPKDN